MKSLFRAMRSSRSSTIRPDNVMTRASEETPEDMSHDSNSNMRRINPDDLSGFSIASNISARSLNSVRSSKSEKKSTKSEEKKHFSARNDKSERSDGGLSSRSDRPTRSKRSQRQGQGVDNNHNSRNRDDDLPNNENMVFGENGFVLEDLIRKAKEGKVDLKGVMDAFERLGSRDEVTRYFQDQIKTNPEKYMQQLEKMRKNAMSEKKMKKLKRIYDENGREAVKMEYEDEYDDMSKEMKIKLIKVDGTSRAKAYLAKKDKDGAIRDYRDTYVNDKTNHFEHMMNKNDFMMMEKLVTGKGLRIPPGAILRQAVSAEDGDVENVIGRKLTKEQKKEMLNAKINKCQQQIREALVQNDGKKLDKLIKEMQRLKGVDDFGNEIKEAKK